jgi:hypothetical protein
LPFDDSACEDHSTDFAAEIQLRQVLKEMQKNPVAPSIPDSPGRLRRPVSAIRNPS